MRESTIRTIHTPLLTLSFIVSTITLGISASLVAYYEDHGYPSTSYKDRIRILLAASILGVPLSLYFGIGGVVAMEKKMFGIMPHLIATGITFLLYLIGVSSLTALTDKTDCGNPDKHGDFPRCLVVKSLVAISWVETIFLLILFIFVFALGVKARSGAGMRHGTLFDA
ncbi:hypothetical protein BT69DRAFT_1346104 [Atractiella rhizophila]|nr:hypothetical protein BT69DRAFT_1346104 [Atractiella rhizophila]